LLDYYSVFIDIAHSLANYIMLNVKLLT